MQYLINFRLIIIFAFRARKPMLCLFLIITVLTIVAQTAHPFLIFQNSSYRTGNNPQLGGASIPIQVNGNFSNNKHNPISMVTEISCTAPSIQAAISTYTNTATPTSLTVNWARGNGNGGVIVVARLTSTQNVDPMMGTFYTAKTVFGTGSATGAGNYVVYQGPGSNVIVTGLTCETSYTFSVYERSITPDVCYKIPGSSSAITTSGCPPVADPFISMQLIPPLVLQSSNSILEVTAGNASSSTIVANSMRLLITAGFNSEILGFTSGDSRWSLASLSAGIGNTITLRNTGPAFNSSDQGQTNIIVKGTVVGGPLAIIGNIAYISGNNPLLGGASNDSQGNSNNTNDNSSSSLMVIDNSCNPPSTQATITAFTNNETGAGLTVNWTRGSGNGGVIVVARLSSTTNVYPLNHTLYTSNTVFETGSSTGAGNYVIFEGSGTSANVTGLTCNRAYSFTVYERNLSPDICYKIPGSSLAVNTPNIWTGGASSAWENPGNWSCGTVPDATTDVRVHSGTVIVNTNVICRSLVLLPGVTFIVNAGFTLTVLY